MIFTNQELAAILRLAHAMANADGKVTNEESQIIAIELSRFGVDAKRAMQIADIGDKMSNAEACQIVSKMTSEEKRYVAAYLGTLVVADRNIEDSEMKLWSLISVLCDLPTMNIMEAVQIMANL